MKQILTTGIILARTDYGEADRIITVLTPDRGKLRLMARGVRKIKSKLAGGIELFSTSHITYIEGRGEIGTLVSTRLIRHYGRIISHIDRVQLGYELIKQLNRATEDQTEADYYELLERAFAALDDTTVPPELINAWFAAQLLRLGGHTPNLRTDTDGQNLDSSAAYNFDAEAMTFTAHNAGRYSANHIKTLRLLFAGHAPAELQKVQGIREALPPVLPLMNFMKQAQLRM